MRYLVQMKDSTVTMKKLVTGKDPVVVCEAPINCNITDATLFSNSYQARKLYSFVAASFK